jgi:[ribosomal protein S5]-alanine N-acetyltransferase
MRPPIFATPRKPEPLPNPPTLSAPGVVLRPLVVSDAEALFSAHGDADTHKYWAGPPHKNVAETARYIEETLERPTTRGWTITEDGGEALGRVAMFVVRDGVGELGIIMRRDATGRGLASKALKLVEEYAFTELEMHRLVADIDPDNNASLSLFLRAGYQREGLLRGNWKTHLGVRDSVIMGKVRE